FFFQAEDGIRDFHVTGVQTCALPILAIAMDRPYRDVYNDLNAFAKEFERQRKRKSSARTGYQMDTLRAYMEKQGWRWVPTMQIEIGRASCRERAGRRGVAVGVEKMRG